MMNFVRQIWFGGREIRLPENMQSAIKANVFDND